MKPIGNIVNIAIFEIFLDIIIIPWYNLCYQITNPLEIV